MIFGPPFSFLYIRPFTLFFHFDRGKSFCVVVEFHQKRITHTVWRRPFLVLYTHRAWPKVWLTIYTISQQQQQHGDTQCRKCDPAGDSHSFFSLRQCTSLSNSCISFFLFFGCYAIYRIISKEISSPVKEHVRYRVNIIVSYYYYIEKREGGGLPPPPGLCVISVTFRVTHKLKLALFW